MQTRITIWIGHEKIRPYTEKISRRSDCIVYCCVDDFNSHLSDGRILRKVQQFHDGRTIYYISSENGRSLYAYFDWEVEEGLPLDKQESPQVEAFK